ncbi:serine/threonine-protein kinase [Mycolicibacter icosiumassiliensis]|uniref:serine/threonine-protein kinase n=1 Tax=Mycolicibacter icosiumassiliensis TaxID=1792835 RepID=UPI00098EFE3F|nr:serine/threonine-protein kinase [Mycolicibacter icosiumassiliensis]
MALAQGTFFAGYRIVRILGTGGMGEVYLAEHPRLPRRDALKILRPEFSADEEFRMRFIREADLAATLWHPGVVRVNDRGESDGQLWISMDYVEGTDAATLLAQHYPGGIPAGVVESIVSAVADALDYAHQRGLLHRDVKPANILLSDPQGGERRVLLGDFGIARPMGDVGGLTATNVALGTLPYAAPEQLMGEPIDGRADQYALAATAYHLLCGTPLFPLSNPAAVISRHLSSPPPSIAAARPDLAALDPVLARALAKSPTDRFASCAEFARSLSAITAPQGLSATAHTMVTPVEQVQAASPSDTSSSAQPRLGRRRARWAIPAVVLLLATAGVVVSAQTHQRFGAPTPPAAALDGTYQLAYHYDLQTLNGAPAPRDPAPASPAPESKPPSSPPETGQSYRSPDVTWWAFRSQCTPDGCVAAATKLDTADHTVADKSGATIALRFIDQRWQSEPGRERVQYPECAIEGGKTVPGADTETTSWTWRPQPDGTLRGIFTDTVLTNECGFQGAVKQVPVTATRVADVPIGVAVADPATISASPPDSSPPPAPTLDGPVLDGLYRLDYDLTKRKVNGVITPSKENLRDEWWAFRSWCGSIGCAATGAGLDADNNQVPNALHDILHFVNGQWESNPIDQLLPMCTVTRNGQTGPEQSPTYHSQKTWTPQADGSLLGVETATVTTNECGNQGTVYEYPFAARRMGDVPPAVVLADPKLFIS